jgi:hypothetical protein
VQRLLGVAIDGDFGQQTELVVKDFQHSEKLEIDGVVGSLTWEKLDQIEQIPIAHGEPRSLEEPLIEGHEIGARGTIPRADCPRPDKPKLSVIVISYNMARELPRTIRSLGPAMQRDIDPSDYEVIAIDNGSTQAFGEDELRALLPGLVIHRLHSATPSPAPAINFGFTVARGDLVGVWIDGARIASPGLLSKALAASRLHHRPVIGTIAFHLGPELQQESIRHGYNRAFEDELLARSGWETDGYRLFTISTLAWSSRGGWFELPEESNALFLRAEHWRALGFWDEGFVSPGGGAVNCDTWARACADPTGMLIMLLGEATFHQFHGGVTTNDPNPPTALFHEEYTRLRGRAFERPSPPAPLFRDAARGYADEPEKVLPGPARSMRKQLRAIKTRT